MHKDYYEKGADYSVQMKVEARSVAHKNLVTIKEETNHYSIIFDSTLASKVGSGEILFYYPAGSSEDFLMPFEDGGKIPKVAKTELLKGKYLVKISWYSEGLKYEVVKTIIVE